MSSTHHMTLKQWMTETGRTLEFVSDETGASISTVSRWKENLSVPRRGAMAKIVAMTKGAVRPESFYLGEDAA